MLSLRGELTAAYAGIETRLTAAGSSLHWDVGDARIIATGLPAGGRVEIADIARRLVDAGLTLHVRDRRGPIADLGAIRRSPVGWVFAGSPRIRPRRLWRWPGLVARRLG